MSKLARWANVVVLSLSVGLLTSACSSGDDTVVDDAGNGDGSVNGSGNGSGDGSGNGSGDGSGNGSGNGNSSGGNNQCTASAVNQDDPCEVCVATSCTAETLACCETPGCLDIITCAQDTGCDGINCYTADTCQAEIDAAGGPSIATQFAMPLGECAATECAAECSLTSG